MSVSKKDLKSALRKVFGLDAFRPGQEQVIEEILNGRDRSRMEKKTLSQAAMADQLQRLEEKRQYDETNLERMHLRQLPQSHRVTCRVITVPLVSMSCSDVAYCRIIP